jgi:hypothetical protein
MTAVFVVFGLIAAGFGIGLIATASAPMGYEDETGFHFGQEEFTSENSPAYPVPQPKPV